MFELFIKIKWDYKQKFAIFHLIKICKGFILNYKEEILKLKKS